MAGPGIDLGSVWASVGLKLDGLFRGVSQAQNAMRDLDRDMTRLAQNMSQQASAAFASVARTYAQMLANLARRKNLTPEEFEAFATRGREAIASLMAAEQQHRESIQRSALEYRRALREMSSDAQREGQQMASQAEQTSRRISSIFDNLGRALERILTGAFSVYAIRRFAQELDDLAATAFSAQAGLNIFARQVARVGEDLDAALRLIAGLANELRTPQEVLARNAAELLRYGYSVRQVVDIFRGAVASGLLVGRTTVESINTVTEALVSQRSVLLNVLGITENLEPAFVRYARSLGKTADELTNVERATAAWQMITRATAAEVADLNLLLEGYGGAVADVGTQTYNLRRVLGEALLPTVTAVRRAWADMLNTLARLAQTTEVRSAIQAIGNAFTSIIGAMRDALRWLTAHRDLIRELAERVIPVLVAALSVRLAQSLAALAANLLTVAGRYTLVIGAVMLLIEAIRMLDEATGQSVISKFFDFVGRQVAWLVAEIQAGWEWLTTGKISAETKRRLDETGRAYDEASRRFREGLSRAFDVVRDPATLWSRLVEVGRQRLEELRRLLAGEPLHELSPVTPSVTGAGGSPPPPPEGSVVKLDDVIKRWQQARALVELGHRATVDLGNGVRELHGMVDEFLFAYADWLAAIVRGNNALFADTASRARAASELLEVLRELYEKFPKEAAERFPRELAGIIAETLAKERDELGRTLDDLALEMQELVNPFRAERERFDVEYRDLRDRITRVFAGMPEVVQAALERLDAWRQAKMDDIARREQEAEDRHNDEHVRSLLQRVERDAELYDWSAAQQAEALDEILNRERMSAALREELTHRVALLRRRAADEAAETERRGAEEAMRLADEAAAAWVTAIERRAELERWSAARTADALDQVLRLATMSADRRAELEHRVALLRQRATEEEFDERSRLLADQARRDIEYVRQNIASLYAQRDALRQLAYEYSTRGPEARQAVELITEAVDELNGEIDKLKEDVRQGFLTQAERQRPVFEARWTVSADDVTVGARGAIEMIRLTSTSLDEQRARLEELLATYEALGEVGRDAVAVIREEIERVNEAIVEQATTLLEVLRTLRDQRGEAIVEATEEIRAAYDEIARLRMTDRQRFEADLADRVAAMRAAGVDAITIEQWVAAQRALYRKRELQAEREAAAEVRREWARALLGPFADPLARLVEGFRAFRVGERLAEAFGSLRQLFADALPDALQSGLARVLSWLRDQATRVGDWFRTGLSWLGQQASGTLGALGGALGSAGGGIASALGGAASAAANALGALAWAAGSFLATLLEASLQFRRFTEAMGLVLRDVALALGGLLEPLIPVIHELRAAFEPILQALYPVFRAFGNIIAQIVRALVPFFVVIAQMLLPVLRALFPVFKLIGEIILTVLAFVGEAWNLFANAINWLLGWLGVNLPTIDVGKIYEARNKLSQTELPPEDTQEELPKGEDEGARGYQISQITGPTRDFFAELLRPIGALNILPGLFDNLTRAVYAVRDLLAASLGTSLAGAADALAAAATSLSDAATRLVAAVEALTASLRSENGAMVIDLVQSMEIARVASVTIARVDVIQVAQAETVQVVGGRVRSPWDWMLGLRGVGA